ncbi:hypothetical protein RND71_035373 [Anisodus tanguticus]|uniref:TCTP domain-containing protein n=1 Tax=Anisodus tanguticus TaxID=243964 RepID=A0AAE1R7J7_9SOLA|nr:hypothetical protein RND71_035373 [Anisodus tanguticus]
MDINETHNQERSITSPFSHWVVQGAIDVDTGENPSAEGGDENEGVDDQAIKVVDIVDTFRLQEQPSFDKKQFVAFMKKYIKNLKGVATLARVSRWSRGANASFQNMNSLDNRRRGANAFAEAEMFLPLQRHYSMVERRDANAFFQKLKGYRLSGAAALMVSIAAPPVQKQKNIRVQNV